MNRASLPNTRPWIRLRADREGELRDAPSWLRPLWVVLIVLTALEALNELGWIGGPKDLFQRWFPDSVLFFAAVLTLTRAVFEPVARRAWVAFGAGMAVWCVGNISWSVVYGLQVTAPYPTFADVLWLLWYPLTAIGVVFLIRVRFRIFELHRWMDGIGVTLIAMAVGFALVVQPVAEHSTQGWLSTVVSFTYPVLDVLLIGALLGLYGLLGWRPDAMWIFIGLGVLASACADAAFAVQEVRGAPQSGHYDFVWTMGALFIAYAAWARSPLVYVQQPPVTGMRAIALALIAQAIAIFIQILAIFKELGKSERIVTALVLVVASIQLILSRPRDHAEASAEAKEPTPPESVPEPLATAAKTDGFGPGSAPP